MDHYLRNDFEVNKPQWKSLPQVQAHMKDLIFSLQHSKDLKFQSKLFFQNHSKTFFQLEAYYTPYYCAIILPMVSLAVYPERVPSSVMPYIFI